MPDPTPVTPVDTVLAGLDAVRADAEDFYRDLHAHPELGLQEHRTAARVAERLRSWGYDVVDGIGGTGVTGTLTNGDGPGVLLRADMDALPVEEATGLPYASQDTAPLGPDARPQPVMHACGHDLHVTCLLAFARLMAEAKDVWHGTLTVLFQPSEENGDGADAMVADGLTSRIPRPDVALAQHVLPLPAGRVGTRPGPFLSAADSLRITVHGRGSHGSRPQNGIDPVVLASMIVIRLNLLVSREIAATTPAVLTVGSITSGTGPNVIPASATLLINLRTYDEQIRTQLLQAVRRVVRAECEASGSPKEPEFERLTEFAPTVNDADTTARVAAAFRDHFGDAAVQLPLQTASEDFQAIPDAFGIPYTYWGIGGADPAAYAEAERAGTIDRDIPVNHSPYFAPAVQPTLDTGIAALTAAALNWLG